MTPNIVNPVRTLLLHRLSTAISRISNSEMRRLGRRAGRINDLRGYLVFNSLPPLLLLVKIRQMSDRLLLNSDP
jgi:hypothetical protein